MVELLVAVLDYLPVADQLRVARTSRRMQEMVYDDTRWVSRLKSMGCWNEREARQRFEDAMRKRREQQATAAANGAPLKSPDTTLFDAATEEDRRKRAASDLRDGFQTMTLGGPADPSQDSTTYLEIFKTARSIRGGARQEYGKIYRALAPFYFDISKAKTHTDPIVFKAFRDPESQAQMLANLKRFACSDWSSGAESRENRLTSMMTIFEKAVLREFEQGYEFWDVDGRMHRYAGVLYMLSGAKSGVNLFLSKHPIFSDRDVSLDPLDCINQSVDGTISLDPSRTFFAKVLAKVNDQDSVIARIFPNAQEVFWEFVDKVREDIIMEYTNTLFDECHERGLTAYLSAFSGVFEQATHFYKSLRPTAEQRDTIMVKSKEFLLKTFEPHMDLYLQEELEWFTKQAEDQVSDWEKKLSEQDTSLENFYMANINRSAEKKDFLSSFKKVVMMPVTVLPSFPIGSPFAAKPTASTEATPGPSRPETPSIIPGDQAIANKVPTDELAAKAAIMASKLEGIKSLCSIEVALGLVHTAQTSLGRAALLIPLGGQIGGEAKEQCSSIFVVLLRILGERHVRSGFDTAVDHLSHYNPRDVSKHDQSGVAPLVTFIELVNVGDLISQMVDVFYEQQLAAPKIVDKNDFLDPSSMAKKKFEQMLDESVAAGLNKGIDVLMDEVEYLNATLQLPTDYNPAPKPAGLDKRGSFALDMDIGATDTAKRIVDLVSSHTSMLVGTTDKSMLDVFNGEVGLRLFTAITKHLKRQRISVDGAIKVIADMNCYFEFVRTLKNQDLLPYFRALRELSQIYLIDPSHAKDMATVIADGDRFSGVFRAEEVYEFAQRRADWYQVKKSVERAMYGMDCCVM